MAISMEGSKPKNFKKNRCSCRLKNCLYFWITTLIWNGHNSYINWANWKISVPKIIYCSRPSSWYPQKTRGTCPRAQKRVLKFVNFKVQFLWNSPIKRFQKHLKSPLHTCESWYLSKKSLYNFFCHKPSILTLWAQIRYFMSKISPWSLNIIILYLWYFHPWCYKNPPYRQVIFSGFILLEILSSIIFLVFSC